MVRVLSSIGAIGVGLAAVIRFRPAILHATFPLDVTIWFEGVIAVFPWMLLAGALSVASFEARLQRATPYFATLGIVYYLFGAIWMILPDIDLDGHEIGLMPTGVFIQSAPDTCAAASAATALHFLGVETTEQEMINAVRARPGRGSTLGRVALGLREELAPGWTVSIENLDALDIAQQARMNRPLLAVIRSAFGADHMIVVLGYCPSGILVANPSPGVHGGVQPLNLPIPAGMGNEIYRPEDFARLIRPGAIVIRPNGDVEAP